jgi:predicted Zn-dependent protease
MSVTGRDHALDDAELAFRTAASLQSSWAAPHQMLAETFLRRGFYEEAIPAAQAATRLDPTMAEAWLTLGRAYAGAGMEEEAAQANAEAARYAPAPPKP